MRHGCCPFKTECLYLHDKRARYMSFQVNGATLVCVNNSPPRWMIMCSYCWLIFHFLAQDYHSDDEDDTIGVDLLNLFIAISLLGGGDDDDDDDDYDFPFYRSEEYGF